MAITNRVSELAKKTKALPDLVSREDLLQASKAIHDQLRESISDHLDSLTGKLNEHLGRLSQDKLGKSFVGEVEKKIKSLREIQNKQLSELDSKMESLMNVSEERLQVLRLLGEKQLASSGDVEETYAKLFSAQENRYKEKALSLQKSHEEGVQQVKELLLGVESKFLSYQESYEKRLDSLEKEYSKKLLDLENTYSKKLSEREEIYKKSLEVTHKMHEDSMQQIRSLLEGFTGITPKVDVHIPAQEAPIVNVTVPEQKAPDVHVSVPQPRLVKKSLSYDEFNRPVEIREEEV